MKLEVLDQMKTGDRIIYEGADLKWYSGVVQEPVSGLSGVMSLIVRPTDKRLDATFARRINGFGSWGHLYRVNKELLQGAKSPEYIMELLASQLPRIAPHIREGATRAMGRAIESLATVVSNFEDN